MTDREELLWGVIMLCLIYITGCIGGAIANHQEEARIADGWTRPVIPQRGFDRK